MTILITGAAGGVGRLLVPLIAGTYKLRLTDLAPVPGVDGTEVSTGDLTDRNFATDITSGIDAVVHLAANPAPDAPWQELAGPNVDALMAVLDGARTNHVRKVVLASSVHALGGHLHGRQPGARVSDRLPPHPCCLYGATKVFGEAAGRVTAESSNTSVIALRLGGCRPVPPETGWLPNWLAPTDLAQLVQFALSADVRYGTYLGVSANTRSPWDITETVTDLGYLPGCNSEIYADQVPTGSDGGTCPPFARPAEQAL